MNTKGFGLSSKVISQLKAIFKNYPAIEEVIIYGSRARGNYRPNSDIDLCLVGDLSFKQLSAIEISIDDLLLPWKMDLTLKNQIDNPLLLENIQREGQLLYD